MVTATVGEDTFQFTPLREGRRWARRAHRRLAYFNSRPSARGDSIQYNMSIRKIISIHAPPRGATIVSAFSHSCLSFQFTPLREGRHHQRVRRCGGNDFNSRPSARGDGICENKKLSPKQFQFTPLREGRRGVKCIVCSQQISIHAPPRGATHPPRRTP